MGDRETRAEPGSHEEADCEQPKLSHDPKDRWVVWKERVARDRTGYMEEKLDARSYL